MPRAIRFATPGDAEHVHAFILELATCEREADAVEVTPEVLRDQLAAERPPFECLIAEEDGEPVGMALFFATYSTWRGRPGLHLEDLYVRPAHRGRGHGLALLRRLAGLAIERGCARLEWAVLDWNAPAIRFYEALGAVPLAEWTTWRVDREALDRLAERPRNDPRR